MKVMQMASQAMHECEAYVYRLLPPVITGLGQMNCCICGFSHADMSMDIDTCWPRGPYALVQNLYNLYV